MKRILWREFTITVPSTLPPHRNYEENSQTQYHLSSPPHWNYELRELTYSPSSETTNRIYKHSFHLSPSLKLRREFATNILSLRQQLVGLVRFQPDYVLFTSLFTSCVLFTSHLLGVAVTNTFVLPSWPEAWSDIRLCRGVTCGTLFRVSRDLTVPPYTIRRRNTP